MVHCTISMGHLYLLCTPLAPLSAALGTVMFLGMSFCLPLAFLEQWQLRRRRAAAGAEEAEARYPLLNNSVAEESFVSTLSWMARPCCMTLRLAIPLVLARDAPDTFIAGHGLLPLCRVCAAHSHRP